MRILNHEAIGADAASSWLYVLHGIFGAGRNWGTVARRLVRTRPDWGVVLVDLREHGASRGFPPPHTVAAAAADLAPLAAETGRPVRAVLGHSFGGKVALAYAATRPPALEQVWVIDSTPAAGEPSGSAWRMLGLIRAMPSRFASRSELVEALVEEGFAPPVGQWMATNLERVDDGYRWRFDLDAVEALIRDFFRADLWPLVENAGPAIRIVKATESSVLSDDVAARIRRAGSGGRVRLDALVGGHWLNADNPDGLIDLLKSGLPGA
ncbi:MAG: alpha/beta hydrolase [Gemmatimonadota bacterium]|jgi:pimeloyl-ACP methyl ester carboxylesterase